MPLFELVIGLLLVGALLTLWADKVGLPYPALLALAGALVALLPGAPGIALDPELSLALFVAPVLLDAAYDASPRDLRANLAAVSSLALMAVALTIVAVALLARLMVPELGWAPAIALGAIVAPPDASAATTVLRRMRLPHRLLVILEGESLFNDASALLVYRVAIAAAMAPAFSPGTALWMLLLTCVGGLLAGVALARLFLWATAPIRDIPVSVLLQFVGTFAVWILAEHLGLSAIITVVTYAMTIARSAPGRIDARHRIASYAVWEVAVFVLNVLAFVLIGLQLRGILDRIPAARRLEYASVAAAIAICVVLVRFVWVMLHNVVARYWAESARRRGAADVKSPSWAAALAISWSGMRGIVTLAAALALPDGQREAAFPFRDLIVLAAFSVVLFTLIVQGATLRPLIRRLKLAEDDTVEREVLLARRDTSQAALRELDGERQQPRGAVELLRREYDARLRSAERPLDGPGRATGSGKLATLQRRLVGAQRRTLMDLRARGVIGDDAFHAAEEELDLLELTADPRVRPGMELE